MKNTIEALRDDIAGIAELLDPGTLFALTAEETGAMRSVMGDLSAKAEALESEFLTVGLIGGTGVGKSSLMNALAEAEIAETSHRRPRTDQVLIYRHADSEEVSLPSLRDVPWREITHGGKSARHLLLCDLPDFDSLVEDHRLRVLRFLEDLDVLVWMTSPEKYGDGRLYELLEAVPKARPNYVFVLNKADQLFEGDSPRRGYEMMDSVAGDFRRHIVERDIPDPILYVISASEAQEGSSLSPWNQFPALRQFLFQQRTVKQVTAIKRANLDIEVRHLLLPFERELTLLERLDAILEDAVSELDKERSRWVHAGREPLSHWVENHITPLMHSRREDPSCLKGPGYVFAVLLAGFQRENPGEAGAGQGASPLIPPEDVTRFFRKGLEWTEHRLKHRFLLENPASGIPDRVLQVLDTDGRHRALVDLLSRNAASHVSDFSLPSFRGFRAFQSLVYIALTIFLLFAVGGQTAWRELLSEPGITGLIGLAVSCTETLFSTKGVAALASYALLNGFLGFHFYRLYRRRLRRALQRAELALRESLLRDWEEGMNAVSTDLGKLRKEIGERSLRIAALTGMTGRR